MKVRQREIAWVQYTCASTQSRPFHIPSLLHLNTHLSLTSLVGIFPISLQNLSHVPALASWNQDADSHSNTLSRSGQVLLRPQ